MEYFGIDVSKEKLDTCWLRDPHNQKIKTKIFKNNSKSFSEIIEWAKLQSKSSAPNIIFTLESTGIYHEQLAMFLYDNGFKVVITNPLHSQNYAKALGVQNKTDKKDSFILAHFSYATNPSFWQPEPLEIRELKALIARLESIEKDLQREKNRLEKATFNNTPSIIIKSINKTVNYLNKQREQFEKLINDHIDNNPNLKKDKKLLLSIPGVGPAVSTRMLTVLHGKKFKNASQVAAFLGLVPTVKESGTSVRKKPQLSKNGNPRIRAKLYMATVSAIQCNPILIKHYNNLLSNGKSKMSALCAAMRKLVHICFGVIKHQQEFKFS